MPITVELWRAPPVMSDYDGHNDKDVLCSLEYGGSWTIYLSESPCIKHGWMTPQIARSQVVLVHMVSLSRSTGENLSLSSIFKANIHDLLGEIPNVDVVRVRTETNPAARSAEK
jgi:hypothetical protein